MWEINTANQTFSFILSLCIGALFCVLYDILRAVRKVCLNSFWSVFLTDILLWIFYAFATFLFLMSRTNGEIRGYVLAGELSGFVLFRLTFSRLMLAVLVFIVTKLAELNKKAVRIFNKLYAEFDILLLKIQQYISKSFKSVKKLLKNATLPLYNKTNIADAKRVSNETKTKA